MFLSLKCPKNKNRNNSKSRRKAKSKIRKRYIRETGSQGRDTDKRFRTNRHALKRNRRNVASTPDQKFTFEVISHFEISLNSTFLEATFLQHQELSGCDLLLFDTKDRCPKTDRIFYSVVLPALSQFSRLTIYETPKSNFENYLQKEKALHSNA